MPLIFIDKIRKLLIIDMMDVGKVHCTSNTLNYAKYGWNYQT